MKDLIFIGSSVCEGWGATDRRGWSAILAEHLERQGWRTVNRSVGGQTTADILLRLERDVIAHRPDACVVGLGLANEGLPGASGRTECRIIQGHFERNLRRIVTALQDAGIRVMLGGVYPNDNYGAEQCEVLRETRLHMDDWGVPVFQWLDDLEDGRGRFRRGLAADAGHPNDAGCAVMARAALRTLENLQT